MVYLVVLFMQLLCSVKSVTFSNEAHLIGELLGNYPQPNARPVLNDSDAITVTYRYIVTQIIELDERRQFVTVNGWMKMEWQDQLMVWNASQYGGVNDIKLSLTDIWTPDITLYNNVHENFEHMKSNIPLSVSSDGIVGMASPAIYNAFCKMDVRFFPFDHQVCHFKFGSWTYGSSKVKIIAIQGVAATQSDFSENGVWGLESVAFIEHSVKYNCCPEPFMDVTMSIGLRRRFEFYVGNVLAPCILLSFLAAFVFFLPPECGEKVSFSITNLLAIVLFQQLIAETLPPSQDTPLIAKYFTLLICLGCFSVLATSVILKIHFGRHTEPVNRFVHKFIVRGVGSVLGIYKDYTAKSQPTNGLNGSACVSIIQCPNTTSDVNTTRVLSQETSSAELNDIMQDIKKFNQQLDEKKMEEDLLKTWTDLASVLDRVMLILCTLFVVISLVVVINKFIQV